MKILHLLENSTIGLGEDDRATRDAWRLVFDLESDLARPELRDILALDLADIGFTGVDLVLPRYLRELINSKRDVLIGSIEDDMAAHRGKRMIHAVRALRGMGFDWPELSSIEDRLAAG